MVHQQTDYTANYVHFNITNTNPNLTVYFWVLIYM